MVPDRLSQFGEELKICMQISTKKIKNDFALPEYGLGTWQMGGRETRNPANDDEADVRAIDNRGNEARSCTH